MNIYHNGYVTKKDSKYVNVHSVNPLYFIVEKVDCFIKEKDGNKYLNFASTDNNKEVLKKYTELWDGIKNLIERIDNSDDNLPLNRPLKLHNLAIIVRSVFQENNKYYPQIYLGKCLYEL